MTNKKKEVTVTLSTGKWIFKNPLEVFNDGTIHLEGAEFSRNG